MSQQPSARRALTKEEQLIVLRDLTKRTSGIHEAQVLQLRLWPFAVDPTLEKAEAHVGPEEDPPLVRYVWTGSKLTVDKPYCDRVLELVRCVKFILGNNWSVEVQKDGEVIFGNGVLNVDSRIIVAGAGKRRKKRPARKRRR